MQKSLGVLIEKILLKTKIDRSGLFRGYSLPSLVFIYNYTTMQNKIKNNYRFPALIVCFFGWLTSIFFAPLIEFSSVNTELRKCASYYNVGLDDVVINYYHCWLIDGSDEITEFVDREVYE